MVHVSTVLTTMILKDKYYSVEVLLLTMDMLEPFKQSVAVLH